MQTHMAPAREKNDDNLTAMMRTFLFMDKENISSNKFHGLMQLQKQNGCPSLTDVIYTHSDTFEDMETALVQTTVDELNKIASSKFVGLIIDETINVITEKKLILFLRVLNNTVKTRTVFLGNHSVHSGMAECIVDKIKEVFKEWGIPLNKVIGLGSDGASVMTGIRNGVGVKLLTETETPFSIHVHCIAHRVAFASQDAANLPKKIADYRKTLNEVYKLYEYSATQYNPLRDLSKELSNTEFLTVKTTIDSEMAVPRSSC
ncbi:hypothetical protein SNE40_014204 [Patella caerulea]|uniref:DUF4371 domain-containing protein n=1 Tax=Patella caerulea TaxID=87958 RepID=A0AAN8JD43_PATCE